MFLPQEISKVKVPPIKIQGIKSKLVPFIAGNIKWDGQGTYFEPFMGSGVVGFNLAPRRAVFADVNPYIVDFYRQIQAGSLTSRGVREFLEREAVKLAATPETKDSYFYEVRDRFNEHHSPLDFLFLQRSNFNGMIRFNSKGNYNVPFCRKPNRFAPALITRIVNQVKWVEQLILGHPEWTFACIPFEDTFAQAGLGDFVYLDPPYIDRHDEYFSTWSEQKALRLAEVARETAAGYALSMWHGNSYRNNDHLDHWQGGVTRTTDHFYFVGARETNRNAMVEALVISPKHVAESVEPVTYGQLTFETI